MYVEETLSLISEPVTPLLCMGDNLRLLLSLLLSLLLLSLLLLSLSFPLLVLLSDLVFLVLPLEVGAEVGDAVERAALDAADVFST